MEVSVVEAVPGKESAKDSRRMEMQRKQKLRGEPRLVMNLIRWSSI